MSRRTDGTASGESNLFEFCRVVTEEDVVNSHVLFYVTQKTQKYADIFLNGVSQNKVRGFSFRASAFLRISAISARLKYFQGN